MKKDIGSRSFVEMYLITKEDKNLFDKCVNHMSQKARGKLEEDYSSTILSQDPTLNNDSSHDKNDESTQPSSEEASTAAKETNTSQNIDGSTVERSVAEDIEKESTRTHTPTETKSKKRKNQSKLSTSKKKKTRELFSTPYSPIKTRNQRNKTKNSGNKYEQYVRWTLANKDS